MKEFFFLFLLSLQLFATDLPLPVWGKTTGPSFFSTDRVTFTFSCPEGWGIGETWSFQEGSRYFTLFPREMGFGCSIQIDRFIEAKGAMEEMARLQQTFPSTEEITSGFEAVFPIAGYSCRLDGLYLIQTWYCVADYIPFDHGLWDQLKRCISITDLEQQGSPSDNSMVKVPSRGWVCHHPDGKLHVLLECDGVVKKAEPPKDPHRKYLLEVMDFNMSGFFYLKWNQSDLHTQQPYEAFLKEIADEIRELESEQQFENSPKYNIENGFALIKGYPYGIVTVAGDQFLYAFAIKKSNSFGAFNTNNFVRRVKWWKDE